MIRVGPLPQWEVELMAIPPACICDWVDEDGNRVLDCRVHPPTDSPLNHHHSPKENTMNTISMTAVAQILVEEGVSAELWHTGGGVYCIYAGQKDAEGRFEIVAGPGSDNGEDIVFDANEVYVARDDEDEHMLADLSDTDATVRQVVDTIKEVLA